MSKSMDSKDRKYSGLIEKALALFETVEEWPDYISFLSKLLKALKQPHTSQNYIPHDLRIAIILSKCLSPNLPSGVHQKTLELYDFIFNQLGTTELSHKVNVWVPGILPIVQFASISIKPLTLSLYRKYLLTLPSSVLKSLIKPILSYLLPSLDDERSEFFEPALDLIDSFKKVLADDPLFWQSVFLIIITSDERRLGCLVWCTKRLPSLTVTVADPEDNENPDYFRTELDKVLDLEQRALITPEAGLLVRAFSSSLRSENLLIQRGFFDLLIKNLQLNSSVLQKLLPSSDLQDLIMTAINAVLKKDMSINRRVWTWLLGPETSSVHHQEYFQKYGRDLMIDGLLKSLDPGLNTDCEKKIATYRICLAIMDRWEIGAEIIPKVLLPILKSVEHAYLNSSDDFQEILKSSSSLFDSVETLTIFSNFYQQLDSDIPFLNFAFHHFAVQEEEMVIHQLPLLLMAALINESKTDDWFSFLKTLLEFIPKRAFLPIDLSDPAASEIPIEDIRKKIDKYYRGSDVLDLPFKPSELSIIILDLITKLFISNIGTPFEAQFTMLLNIIIDSIPELSYSNSAVTRVLTETKFNTVSIVPISKLFTKYTFSNPFDKLNALKSVVFQLCSLLTSQGAMFQVEIVKSLQHLSFEVSPYYVEASISLYLLSLDDFNQRLLTFDYLWGHATDIGFLDRPLHILLNELDPVNTPINSILEAWILSNINSGYINRFFQLVTNKLHDSLDDPEIFIDHVNLLFKILKIDSRRLAPLFKEELTVISSIEYKDEDVSTYKSYVLFELGKFLESNIKYDPKILGSVFKLYELLLDGSESSFEKHVAKVFDIAENFVTNQEQNAQYDDISVVLFNHLTKLTTLVLNSHGKVTKLLVSSSRNNNTPYVIEFLLSSFEKFNKPQLLVAWIDLLSNSLKFQDERIFEFVEPIALIILSKIDSIYGNSDSHSKDDVAVSLLLGIVQEVLSLLRTYVVTLEINSVKETSQSDPGFFTSVVSGVFSTDGNTKKSNDAEVSDARRVLIVCFKEAVETCFKIWTTSDSILKFNNPEQLTIKYQSMKLKHKSKVLLESLYELEPEQILRTLIFISGRSNGGTEGSGSVFKLLHVLDGTKPQLTIPHIFRLLRESVNQKGSSPMSPSSLEMAEFLVSYTCSLQNDSVEDIFVDTMLFLKNVTSDLNAFKPILLNIVRFISVIGEKLNHSKFGEQRKVKKDVSDIFLKIFPVSLSVKNADIALAIASAITDQSEQEAHDANAEPLNSLSSSQVLDQQLTSYEDICIGVKFIIQKLGYVVFDQDKQSSVISTILMNLVTPYVKSRKQDSGMKNNHIDLLIELVKYYPSSKSLRFLISEVFNDPQFFYRPLSEVSQWSLIVKGWLNEEVGDKIMEYLSKCTQSSGPANIFSWNENEHLLKIKNLRKVTYLLLIDGKDKHIVLLKELFNKMDELSNQGGDLSSLIPEIFTLLRAVVLRYSHFHLYDYWTFIYTALQRFFTKVLDAGEVDLERISVKSVLQACKLLDLLLVLKYEDFQEWIFVIDTINAIFKNTDIVSLIDKIALKTENLQTGSSNEKSLFPNRLTASKDFRRPALAGVKTADSFYSFKPFFDGLSYYNYENIYNCLPVDYELCENDVYRDLFDSQ